MAESFLTFCSDKDIPFTYWVGDQTFQMNPGNIARDQRMLSTPMGTEAGLLWRFRTVVRGRWGPIFNTLTIGAHITKNGVLLPETEMKFYSDGALWVTTHSKEVFPEVFFNNEDTIGLNLATVGGMNDPTKFYVSAVAVFQH